MRPPGGEARSPDAFRAAEIAAAFHRARLSDEALASDKRRRLRLARAHAHAAGAICAGAASGKARMPHAENARGNAKRAIFFSTPADAAFRQDDDIMSCRGGRGLIYDIINDCRLCVSVD